MCNNCHHFNNLNDSDYSFLWLFAVVSESRRACFACCSHCLIRQGSSSTNRHRCHAVWPARSCRATISTVTTVKAIAVITEISAEITTDPTTTTVATVMISVITDESLRHGGHGGRPPLAHLLPLARWTTSRRWPAGWQLPLARRIVRQCLRPFGRRWPRGSKRRSPLMWPEPDDRASQCSGTAASAAVNLSR